MKRIESNEYFKTVKEYIGNHKEPARAYRFLINLLRTDKYKLTDDLIYVNIDTLETTDDCFRFCSGAECILVLCSEPIK